MTPILSVRARQALGAALVEEFCRSANIHDPDLDVFISHLWSVVRTSDIPRWDDEGKRLVITGRGDPLPSTLLAKVDQVTATRLGRVLEFANEISLSQIYGTTQPTLSDKFLKQAIDETGLNIASREIPAVFAQHSGGANGWGEAVSDVDFLKWQTAARSFTRT